ncbi:hypothetical protein [Streptomyces sp. NPDC001381]
MASARPRRGPGTTEVARTAEPPGPAAEPRVRGSTAPPSLTR